MNIGIYKPTKKIYFFNNEEDHGSWSAEIIDIAKLLVSKGHSVYMMSETDYDNSIRDIFVYPSIMTSSVKVDKIFVFNGYWLPEIEAGILEKLKKIASDINYIFTDMRLPTNFPEKYNHIFTQSKRLYAYGAIQEHCLIDTHTGSTGYKTIPYYFGGTERGRTKDFMEYINQPECEWYGKSETLGINKYIPYDKHLEMLKKAKTTIIIADEVYNEIGFVNDRYYQCARYDVICFADSKWDPDELIMSKKDWRRVSSYKELCKKQDILKKDLVKYFKVLNRQRHDLRGVTANSKLYDLIMQ